MRAVVLLTGVLARSCQRRSKIDPFPTVEN